MRRPNRTLFSPSAAPRLYAHVPRRDAGSRPSAALRFVVFGRRAAPNRSRSAGTRLFRDRRPLTAAEPFRRLTSRRRLGSTFGVSFQRFPFSRRRVCKVDGVFLRRNGRAPQTANRQPPTADRQPPTANRQPPTANRQPPTADRRPPTADRQPPTANRRPPTAERRTPNAERRTPTVNRQSSIVNRQSSIVNRQPPTANRQPSIVNRQSSIVNRQPSTANRQPPTAAKARVLRSKVDAFKDFFAATLDLAKSTGYNRTRRGDESRFPLAPPSKSQETRRQNRSPASFNASPSFLNTSNALNFPISPTCPNLFFPQSLRRSRRHVDDLPPSPRRNAQRQLEIRLASAKTRKPGAGVENYSESRAIA